MAATRQRHTRSFPCPVCGGYDPAPRGEGVRCYGFTSGDWTHCTREEHAGGLPFQPESSTYAHKLGGPCNCWVEHQPAPSPPSRRQGSGQPPQGDYYTYVDEGSNYLFDCVRMPPKRFTQGHFIGGKVWHPGLGGNPDYCSCPGIRRVLYRLPELLAADPREIVWICEGEKDVDNLRDRGLVATCNPMGAKKWYPEYNGALEGRHVVSLEDNDRDGRDHVQMVAHSLHGMAASVKVLRLPGLPEHGDVSDWLADDDPDHDVLNLRALASQTPEWVPPEATEINRAAQAAQEEDTRLAVVSILQVVPRSVDWIWYPRIPVGKLTIIGGDPGLGKSLLTLDMAARLSIGRVWPDGGDAPLGNVLLITVEDDLEDTVRPRLDQMDEVDMRRIYAINPIVQANGTETLFSLADHLVALERAILEHEALLLILDPLLAFIGRKADAHKMSEVRAVLSPLAAMADRARCAILGILHPNKRSSEMNSLYRLTSSLDFVAAARAVHVVGKHPEMPTHSVLAPVKMNLGPMPQSLMYHIIDRDGVAYLSWDSAVDLDANAVMAPPANDGPARAEAKEFLLEFLGKGEATAPRIYEEADARDIKRRTLHRARKELDIDVAELAPTPGKKGRPGVVWRLPEKYQES